MAEKVEWGESFADPLGHYVRSMNFNLVFVIVMVGFVVFAAIPLMVIAAKCA